MGIKDGGAAFPCEAEWCDGAEVWPASKGMTLRDYLAANAPKRPDDWIAPTTMLIACEYPTGTGAIYDARFNAYRAAQKHNTLMHDVDWRWAYADAMLAARGEQP